jgi:hypothetical protein
MADDPALPGTRLELYGDLPASPTGHSLRIEDRHGRLFFGGIELERGLVLRPIDSVRRIKTVAVVYNLQCNTIESYIANGFVVHNCFYANTGELGGHRKVFLARERTLLLLEEAIDLGIKAITWTGGGDPALHPDIDTFVDRADHLGLDQGMFTNALARPRFDPAALDWVRVTVTDKPLKPECIKGLRTAKTLGFAFNYAGPKDIPLLWETLKVAEQVQADYVQLRPALAFHGLTVHITPPDLSHPLLQVTDYKFEAARVSHGYKRCEGYHFVPFVWEDGNVDVCSYMRKHEGYTLGNIYDRALKQILDDAPDSVAVHPNCQVCCKLHEINKVIDKSRQLRDVNFP